MIRDLSLKSTLARDILHYETRPKVGVCLLSQGRSAVVWVDPESFLFEVAMLVGILPKGTRLAAAVPFGHGIHEPWTYGVDADLMVAA